MSRFQTLQTGHRHLWLVLSILSFAILPSIKLERLVLLRNLSAIQLNYCVQNSDALNACTQSVKYSDDLLNTGRVSQDIVMHRARLLALVGRADSAVSFLRDNNAWPSTDSLVRFLIARTLISTKASETQLVEDLILDPQRCDDWYMVNLIDRMESLDSYRATGVYQQVYELCGNNLAGVLAAGHLSRLASLRGDLSESLLWQLRLLSVDPYNAEYWAELSRIQMELGNLSEAIGAANHSIALDDTTQNIAARAFRGIACFRQGDANCAIEDLEWTKEAGTTSPYNLTSLADAYARIGRIEDATHLLVQILNDYPDYGYANRLLLELSETDSHTR